MWTLQMFGNQTFKVSDEQAVVIQKAIENNWKVVGFLGFTIAVSGIEFLISEEMEKNQHLLLNPILNDEAFRGLCDSGEARFANMLDSRYPLPKYQKEWDEANANKDFLKKVVKLKVI